jgi:hypothetical protein
VVCNGDLKQQCSIKTSQESFDETRHTVILYSLEDLEVVSEDISSVRAYQWRARDAVRYFTRREMWEKGQG